jgi:TIR domain-containing protein
MSDIFISYKREEQATARKLANALEGQGWTVWWDPKLRAEERFNDVIEKALKESKCVVVMWSKRSVESRYVKHEANYALKRNKRPLMIEEVDCLLDLRTFTHRVCLIGIVGGSVLVPGRGSSIVEITRFQLQQFKVSIKELAEWFGLEVAGIVVDESLPRRKS